MGRRGNSTTRGEVSETVKEHEVGMREKEEDLDVLATDAETVRDTLDSLDFSGTSEGVDAVEAEIEEADNVTVEIFEREDDSLESIQGDSEEYQNELQGRNDSDELDLGKISDAAGRVTTQETVGKLADAKNAVSEDMDFLKNEIDQANEARQQSEEMQRELKNRISNRRK